MSTRTPIVYFSKYFPDSGSRNHQLHGEGSSPPPSRLFWSLPSRLPAWLPDFFYSNAAITDNESPPLIAVHTRKGIAPGRRFTIDASTTILTLQVFDGSADQQFTFVCASRVPGIFYIVHASTGLVLEGTDGPISLNKLENSTYQQWQLNADGRISSRGGTLDIVNGYFVPGSTLQLAGENGTPSQYFFIDEKM
ncbi:hypothetical protein Zmor_024474 [Zophobas morio]|uniref:Ricin B lectin domain-containing protein n=1 Tax=Zophobas morio TaxID=2755281 RepID=A0AA38HYT6_9CUCU|nr:hypothetical protein Zmor_024474 [Zophobas morio]